MPAGAYRPAHRVLACTHKGSVLAKRTDQRARYRTLRRITGPLHAAVLALRTVGHEIGIEYAFVEGYVSIGTHRLLHRAESR